jgi:hypothetical protein
VEDFLEEAENDVQDYEPGSHLTAFESAHRIAKALSSGFA